MNQTDTIMLKKGKIPMNDKNLKCVYRGLVESSYNLREIKPVYEFVIGRYEGKKLLGVARVTISEENIDKNEDGGLTFKINNKEYAMRFYSPNEKSFNRNVIFSRLKQILEESN